jgi:hypothetical protein
MLMAKPVIVTGMRRITVTSAPPPPPKPPPAPKT